MLDLDDPASDARKAVTALCARAAESDGCDSIVLGCAGMASFCAKISREIGIPVIDGVAAATKLAESLVALGLRTPGRGEFARPGLKRYAGLLGQFAIGPATD